MIKSVLKIDKSRLSVQKITELPSEDFYIYLGAVGFAISIVGFLISMNTAVPAMAISGSIILLTGIVMLIIMGGGAAFDIYKRVKGWRLEEREDNLYYKEKEREVKQKEEELKRQRRQAKEEERRRAESDKARRRAEEAAREGRTRYREKEASYKKPPKEEVSGFGPEKKEHTEGSWFGTGDKVPEDLKKKKSEEQETQYSKADQNELEKESQSEKDYQYQISLDKHLLLLWTLYKTKEHEFTTRNQLVLAANGGQKGNREPWYAAIDELEKMDLLKRINEKRYAGKEPEWGDGITDVGLLLIKKARYDQVNRFDDFKEKYAVYLRR